MAFPFTRPGEYSDSFLGTPTSEGGKKRFPKLKRTPKPEVIGYKNSRSLFPVFGLHEAQWRSLGPIAGNTPLRRFLFVASSFQGGRPEGQKIHGNDSLGPLRALSVFSAPRGSAQERLFHARGKKNFSIIDLEIITPKTSMIT